MFEKVRGRRGAGAEETSEEPRRGLLRRAPKGEAEVSLGATGRLTKPKKDWRLRSVVDHVSFVGDGGVMGEDRMIAWYVADPQQWSFRSQQEGTSLIHDQATTLSKLIGTSVYIRVTTRPYPVAMWAKAAYANAPEPQPGYEQMMDRDQRHMAGSSQVDKLVYYGVDLGQRGTALAMLGKINAGIVDREMKALQARLSQLDHVVGGPGLAASPATPEQMDWLLARSFALGCPVPVPDPSAPTSRELDADEIAGFASTASWSADPLSPVTKITTSVNDRQVTRYVCVLTVGRTADLSIPEKDSPWMAKTDQLGFPVEWSARIDLRPPEAVSKEMNRLSLRVDGQQSHWVDDHGKRPPKQLNRQAARIADIEDEMRSGFTGLSTRTKGWYRIAVSGQSVDEALARAEEVRTLYNPQITIVREMGQYQLAREFIPGEPLASTAHSRKFPVMKVAAGLPAITSEVGDKRGHHLGETTGLSARAVVWDPWFLPEVIETGGLVPVVGTLGSGKTVVSMSVAYKAVLSGVRGVVLDPSGRMNPLLRLPELAPISQAVNLIGGREGTLSPYAVVPDPDPRLIQLDMDDVRDEEEYRERMRLAESAARAQRRDLTHEALRWCLPLELGRNNEALRLLRRAIGQSPDQATSSANAVIEWLEDRGDDGQEIADALREARERELGRLFFAPERAERPHYESGARLTAFNLKGLVQPDPHQSLEDATPDELLARPILSLASWAALSLIYRRDPNERKLFVLDEAHEITEGSGSGRALVQKISTDSRKNNTVALVSTQNASRVLGADIANFAGACLVGRTGDEEAQKDALRLLGKPLGVGYEELLGNLSRKPRDGQVLPYREFIFRDGLGGEGGRGGMEMVRVGIQHHPELFAALDSTPDQRKTAAAAAAEAAAAEDAPVGVA